MLHQITAEQANTINGVDMTPSVKFLYRIMKTVSMENAAISNLQPADEPNERSFVPCFKENDT